MTRNDHMTRPLAILAALALAACTAPPVESTAHQAMCMLDPATGQCAGAYQDPTDLGVTETTDYTDGNYPGTTYQVSCDNDPEGGTAGNGMLTCSTTTFWWFNLATWVVCYVEYTYDQNGIPIPVGVTCEAK